MRGPCGLGLVVLLCSVASAQLPTSTLNGTVTDPQGAAVTNAKVILTSLATGVAREATSNAQGFYTFANVVPGDYRVDVGSPTFAKAEMKEVRLEVGHAFTLDVSLKVAKAGEIVEVTGAELAVNTTQS